MSNGLKGKVREMVTRMDESRQGEGSRDINLRQFMAENYKDNDGNPLAPEHLYSELGIDPNRTQVSDLMADRDNSYLMSEVIRDGILQGMGIAQRARAARTQRESLAPITADGGRERFVSREIFLDPVNRGIVQSTFFPDLVMREIPVDQPNVTVPYIDLSDAALKDSNEAATIEEGTVTYGSKDVKIAKKARGLNLTYESIRFNSLSLAQVYFQDIGRMLGHTLNGMAVSTIVDGDQANGSEAAAVIGVEDVAKGITWFDLARVAIQFGLISRTGMQAIGNAQTALDYINLDEVKNKQFAGSALLSTVVKSPLTMPEELYPSTKVADNQLVIQDPSMSIVQLTAQPLLIETDNVIMKQIEQAAFSIYTGFAKVQRNASVIIDGEITFAANGFPVWMQPHDD